MIASAPGTSSIMCKWFRCGDLWPFQAQISWTDLPECQIPLTYIYGTFSYSGCSEVELLISKKGWGCKHYINEDHNGLKGHTSRKIFLWSYYSGELLLPCRLLHQEVSHLQQYQPSRWHTVFKEAWDRLQTDALSWGAPVWDLLCTPGLHPRDRSTPPDGPAQCLHPECLSAEYL